MQRPSGARRTSPVEDRQQQSGCPEDGPRILVEKAIFSGLDIIKELEQFDSRYDKAMVTLLRYPSVWEAATTLVHVEKLSRRYWYRRGDLPKQPPDICEEQ